MAKLATPVSRFFRNADYAEKINKLSDCLECRDESINFKGPRQEVFHCDLQPIHNFFEKEFTYLRKVKKLKKELKLITFHCASSCNKPVLNKYGIFGTGGKSYSKEEMQKRARDNFSKIKKIFGAGVKIGIENNNYYPTPAYKYITEPEFITEIVSKNKIGFLFDIAHAKITCRNQKRDYQQYKDGLPLNGAVQLHVSHYGLGNDGLAHDFHYYPTKEEIEEIRDLVKRQNVEYLTIEYYKDIKKLIQILKKL